MSSKKTIVTARSVMDKEHIFIRCSDTYTALKIAGEIHRLGEKRYYQVRLRSSIPSKKYYVNKTIQDILMNIS